MNKKTAVIGGGAAGMMASAQLIASGADVTLFEKNDRVGLKLGITGKGRCNVTNNCTLEEFMSNIPSNPRFLYSAFNSFSSADTIDFFENLGVKLKTERGNRVFPVSDRALDIVYALKNVVAPHTVHKKVTQITAENGKVSGLIADEKKYQFDSVIICTGGISYPKTGSTGDGFRFAQALGHTIIPPRPSLVPLESPDRFCADMQGLSLKNVSAKIIKNQTSEVYSDFGEMMFTHFGVTGPMILSASCAIDGFKNESYTLHIDLKPALDEKKLDSRLLLDFEKNINKDYANSLSGLLPSKMIPVFVSLSGVSADKKVNSITKEERKKIISLLKDFPVRLSGFRPIEEAIITKGGVSVKEINPKTMESKLISGLFFAGEVIDVDGYTGGFNLQIAFSTAACAAKGIMLN